MNDDKLMWKVESRETILHTVVYDIEKRHTVSADGISGDYIVADAPDWVITIPVHQGNFILVRQYRHGYGNITTEFPGGVSDDGEDPRVTAARELEEETGFRAGKVTLLGSCSPNPALFSNTLHICLCEDIEKVSEQHPDEDEVITYFERPVEEVIDDYCSGEYMHAYMGTALAMYLREERKKGSR